MPKIQRMTPTELQGIRDMIAAVKAMTGYAPRDTDVTVAALETALSDWSARSATETQKENEAAAAQDATATVEAHLRDLRKRTNLQVAAQFGKNSDEYASLGLKKESEYQRRSPKNPAQ